MLTGIEVYSETGNLVLTLPVAYPEADVPYLITNIDGLDPVGADITTTANASQDGVFIQNSRVNMRNIVMAVSYRPGPLIYETVGYIRNNLYKIFPPKATVKLRFIDTDHLGAEVKRDITGQVESHETAYFSDDPTVQISILCPDPYFSALDSVTTDDKANDIWYPFNYEGTAPTGFVFKALNMASAISWVEIHNKIQRELLVDRDFLDGDGIEISTVRGNKYITHYATNGTANNGLGGLTRGSLSTVLDTRVDEIKVRMPSASFPVYHNFTYTPKFLGL